MSYTYLTAQQLAEKIQYDARTIRNQLKDSVFIEGVHYIERGYESIIEKLRSVGADIKSVYVPDEQENESRDVG